MEWKMFGIKGKLVSAKQKVFRLISGLGKEDPNVPLLTPAFTTAHYEALKPFMNLPLEAELLGAELKKAQTLMYWRMFMDRPK